MGGQQHVQSEVYEDADSAGVALGDKVTGVESSKLGIGDFIIQWAVHRVRVVVARGVCRLWIQRQQKNDKFLMNLLKTTADKTFEETSSSASSLSDASSRPVATEPEQQAGPRGPADTIEVTHSGEERERDPRKVCPMPSSSSSSPRALLTCANTSFDNAATLDAGSILESSDDSGDTFELLGDGL